MSAVQIPFDSVKECISDRLGVCIGCGSLTDPVPVDAVGQPCESCHLDLVVGLVVAIELGAVRIVAEAAHPDLSLIDGTEAGKEQQ